MSQYSSYIEQSLANKLVKLEQEMVNLKAKQIYGTQQVQTYESNTVSSNGVSVYISEYQVTLYGTDILHLRFEGDKPSKTIIAELMMSWSGSGLGEYTEAGYFKIVRVAQNIVDWYLWVDAVDGSSANWSANFKALTNDSGRLSIVEQFPFASNLWVIGSGG